MRLDFSNGNFRQPGDLAANVMEQLAAAERRTGVATEYETAPGRFASLLETLAKETGAAGRRPHRRIRQADAGRAR